MNYKTTIKALRQSRADWIDILVGNPNNSQAAQHILSINAKLDLLDTMRFAEGDFSIIE